MADRSAAARKAHRKRKHKAAGERGWIKVKERNFDPKKEEFLLKLARKTKHEGCLVCKDKRKPVLQNHHLSMEIVVITLCANCHDLIRRGTLKDLITAHELGSPHA